MSQWAPHVTVATVIEDEGRYLLVEERDKASGALVFNQPAGHLEQAETLPQAALRETLEETGWELSWSVFSGSPCIQPPPMAPLTFAPHFSAGPCGG